MIIPTILTVIIAWWFSRSQDVEYTSVAELSTGYMDASPLDYNSRVQNNTLLYNNVIQTLQSTQILDQVSYALLLHDLGSNSPFLHPTAKNITTNIGHYPGGKSGLIISLSKKIDSFYVLDLAREDDRLIREIAGGYGYSADALLDKIQINRIAGSDFILITATTSNSSLSAFVANEICRSFLALYQDKVGQASAVSLDTLRSMMETKKQILDNKLNLLQDSSDATLSGSAGILSMLQGQLTQQKGNLIAAQVSLENVDRQINQMNKLGGLANNEEIIALRTNIDNLYARYVNGGSADANLLHQIDQLRTSLQQKLSSAGASSGNVSLGDLMKQKMDLDVKINVAKQTMKDLQDKISGMEGAVQSSAARQGIVQGIQSEIGIARQQYEEANKLYNDALNRNMFPGNDFKQVLKASPSLYPNASEKVKIVGFAGSGVFFFSIFLLLFFEFVDPAIKTSSYLKANTLFPLLANFRRISAKELSVNEIFSTKEPISRSVQGFKEQVKQLRYEVQRAKKKRLLVMGYHAGSGRTTIIECLARSLSLSNKAVLLVDANFHNNTLTRKYNANKSVETFETLGDQTLVNKGISSLATMTEVENIWVVGCNGGDYTPDEVLPPNNIFLELRDDDEYDYILVDCASLDRGPDSKELLKYVDGVILAYAADQPLTEEDRKLEVFIEEANIYKLGVVLNKIPSHSVNL